VVPEPTSIENGYRFIKSALYRRLRKASSHAAVRELVESALDQKNPRGIRTPMDLLDAVEAHHPEALAAMKRELGGFRPHFIVNQVRNEADVAIGHQLVAACARHLGIRATYAGYVPYDDSVWQCVRQRRLFVAAAEGSHAAQRVRELARGLASGESLTLAF
jgi:flagellar biosynthesis protein FlhG